MAVISLPLTFQNSFWSQDYRKGLEVLFSQLERGVAENEEIVAFIRARATAELAIAATLTTPTPIGSAFHVEDGASLLMAFRGLKEESVAEGKAHETVGKDLQTKIAGPFEEWANGYRERLGASKAHIVDGWLRAYEVAQQEVDQLKEEYLSKTRRADEAEDDARFAPITQAEGDKYTTSPSLAPRDKRVPRQPTRQQTVSERITARFKEFRLNASTATDTKPEVTFDADAEDVTKSPKVDKGKGRAVETGTPEILASPPPLSPPLPPMQLATDPVPAPPAPPVILAGLPFAAQEVSALLSRAKSELPLRAVRFPLLGEYKEVFSGDEFVTWLKDNVKGFEGSLDRAEDAARELTQSMNLLRRLGELGNDFESADDAYYQFRPKAFNLDAPKPKEEGVISPIQKNLTPLAENVSKRTSTFANLVSKALNTNGVSELAYVKARREADTADQAYRDAVRKLDRQRLGLEERIEDTLKTLQKWQLDRLRAVKTVLTQYHTCLESRSTIVTTSLERSSTLIASYQPEADLKALMEQYRTGPFRPTAQVYASIAHDEPDVVFGIDLRKWADLGVWNPSSPTEGNKDAIPPMLTALLTALNEAYPKIPNDAEKRKTWIYDVPLPAVHHLRETLNAVPPEQDIPDDTLAKYDAPILAGAIKLWALELDPPLCMYEGWDEFRKLYPTVGSVKSQEQPSEEQRIQDLQVALLKLPRVHLNVLDTILKHLKDLAASTTATDESDELYFTKLALSIGRTILRPKVETEFSIQDRHPTLLFLDLLSKYAEIMPPTLAKKKRESERKVPVRKRTRLVDMRMSRSRISGGADLKELHAQQMAQRTGRKQSPPAGHAVPPVPEVPEGARTSIPAPVVQVTPADSAPPVFSDEPGSILDTAAPPVAEPEEIQVKSDRTLPTVPPSPVIPAKPPTPVNFANIPPPPPLFAPVPVAPPSKPTTSTAGAPSRPMFKEPPPEDDDYPPRPTFKEPPPTSASPPLPMPDFADPLPSPPLPMPNFREPPPEPASPPAHASIPPVSSRSMSPPKAATPRSASPTKASVTRQSSVSSNTAPLRGPRISRGPRGPGGGNVSNLIGNLNRNSMSGSPRPESPGKSPSRPMSGHVKRSSASRSSTFERRTMASDAEDEIVR